MQRGDCQCFICSETQFVKSTKSAIFNCSARALKSGCSAPSKLPKTARSELRSILRRCPNEAFTTRTKSASSQSSFAVELRRRRITALLTFGGGLKTFSDTVKRYSMSYHACKSTLNMAVLARTRRLGDADGDLLLNHADALRHEVAVLDYLEEYLRRDVVWEIADDAHSVREASGEVRFQKIAFDKPRRELGVVGVEILYALAVDFGTVGRDVAALQQILCQHAHSASDLQYVVGCAGVACRQRVAYLARYVEVGQEVLTERFLCSYFRHNHNRDFKVLKDLKDFFFVSSVSRLAHELDAHEAYLLLGVVAAQLLDCRFERIRLGVLLKI